MVAKECSLFRTRALGARHHRPQRVTMLGANALPNATWLLTTVRTPK